MAHDGNRSNGNTAVSPARGTSSVRVEYPKEGEVLVRPCYTIRIGAVPNAAGIEVSINQGAWMPCREALGSWWYDWADYAKGEYVLVARSREDKARATASTPRRFSVT